MHVFYTSRFFFVCCNVRAESTSTHAKTILTRENLFPVYSSCSPFFCVCLPVVRCFRQYTDARPHYDILQCKFRFIERQCVSMCRQIVVVFVTMRERDDLQNELFFSLISIQFTTEPATTHRFMMFVFILYALCLDTCIIVLITYCKINFKCDSIPILRKLKMSNCDRAETMSWQAV